MGIFKPTTVVPRQSPRSDHKQPLAGRGGGDEAKVLEPAHAPVLSPHLGALLGFTAQPASQASSTSTRQHPSAQRPAVVSPEACSRAEASDMMGHMGNGGIDPATGGRVGEIVVDVQDRERSRDRTQPRDASSMGAAADDQRDRDRDRPSFRSPNDPQAGRNADRFQSMQAANHASVSRTSLHHGHDGADEAAVGIRVDDPAQVAVSARGFRAGEAPPHPHHGPAFFHHHPQYSASAWHQYHDHRYPGFSPLYGHAPPHSQFGVPFPAPQHRSHPIHQSLHPPHLYPHQQPHTRTEPAQSSSTPNNVHNMQSPSPATDVQTFPSSPVLPHPSNHTHMSHVADAHHYPHPSSGYTPRWPAYPQYQHHYSPHYGYQAISPPSAGWEHAPHWYPKHGHVQGSRLPAPPPSESHLPPPLSPPSPPAPTHGASGLNHMDAHAPLKSTDSSSPNPDRSQCEQALDGVLGSKQIWKGNEPGREEKYGSDPSSRGPSTLGGDGGGKSHREPAKRGKESTHHHGNDDNDGQEGNPHNRFARAPTRLYWPTARFEDQALADDLDPPHHHDPSAYARGPPFHPPPHRHGYSPVGPPPPQAAGAGPSFRLPPHDAVFDPVTQSTLHQFFPESPTRPIAPAPPKAVARSTRNTYQSHSPTSPSAAAQPTSRFSAIPPPSPPPPPQPPLPLLQPPPVIGPRYAGAHPSHPYYYYGGAQHPPPPPVPPCHYPEAFYPPGPSPPFGPGVFPGSSLLDQRSAVMDVGVDQRQPSHMPNLANHGNPALSSHEPGTRIDHRAAAGEAYGGTQRKVARNSARRGMRSSVQKAAAAAASDSEAPSDQSGDEDGSIGEDDNDDEGTSGSNQRSRHRKTGKRTRPTRGPDVGSALFMRGKPIEGGQSRSYLVFTRDAYQKMVKCLQLAANASEDAYSSAELRKEWKEVATSSSVRKRWKRLQFNLRVVLEREEYRQLAWRSSTLIIAPREDWDAILREAHHSDLPPEQHASVRQTIMSIRERYETRRSRCGITAEAIDSFCHKCECYRRLLHSINHGPDIGEHRAAGSRRGDQGDQSEGEEVDEDEDDNG